MFTLFPKKSTVSPAVVGLAQAAGVILYVVITAFLATSGSLLFGPLVGGDPILGAIGFLAFFCFSALTCGLIALGYPVLLLVEKRYRRAFLSIGWTIGWMFLFLAVLALVLATMVPQQGFGY